MNINKNFRSPCQAEVMILDQEEERNHICVGVENGGSFSTPESFESSRYFIDCERWLQGRVRFPLGLLEFNTQGGTRGDTICPKCVELHERKLIYVPTIDHCPYYVSYNCCHICKGCTRICRASLKTARERALAYCVDPMGKFIVYRPSLRVCKGCEPNCITSQIRKFDPHYVQTTPLIARAVLLRIKESNSRLFHSIPRMPPRAEQSSGSSYGDGYPYGGVDDAERLCNTYKVRTSTSVDDAGSHGELSEDDDMAQQPLICPICYDPVTPLTTEGVRDSPKRIFNFHRPTDAAQHYSCITCAHSLIASQLRQEHSKENGNVIGVLNPVRFVGNGNNRIPHGVKFKCPMCRADGYSVLSIINAQHHSPGLCFPPAMLAHCRNVRGLPRDQKLAHAHDANTADKLRYFLHPTNLIVNMVQPVAAAGPPVANINNGANQPPPPVVAVAPPAVHPLGPPPPVNANPPVANNGPNIGPPPQQVNPPPVVPAPANNVAPAQNNAPVNQPAQAQAPPVAAAPLVPANNQPVNAQNAPVAAAPPPLANGNVIPPPVAAVVAAQAPQNPPPTVNPPTPAVVNHAPGNGPPGGAADDIGPEVVVTLYTNTNSSGWIYWKWFGGAAASFALAAIPHLGFLTLVGSALTGIGAARAYAHGDRDSRWLGGLNSRRDEIIGESLQSWMQYLFLRGIPGVVPDDCYNGFVVTHVYSQLARRLIARRSGSNARGPDLLRFITGDVFEAHPLGDLHINSNTAIFVYQVIVALRARESYFATRGQGVVPENLLW
jgi:hypothetical protein